MIPDFTLVVGVDARHLKQLEMTWPTWRKHKPSLLDRPMLAFYDQTELTARDVRIVIDNPRLAVFPWSPVGAVYSGSGEDKWNSPQRHKMLAGFVHAPAGWVETPYWLKIDTDVVATGYDNWIEDFWFEDNPAIIAHPWSFTKPPEQMLRLNQWASTLPVLGMPVPGLVPTPGSDRLAHQRIISWCGFFNTEFTRKAAGLANLACGIYQLPVPSQDGYLWFMAKWLGWPIVRASMKNRGWTQWSADFNVKRYAEEAMRG